MNTTLMIIGLVTGGIALLVVADKLFTNQGHITSGEIVAKAASGALLIDVRSADEYARRHIDGAVNIPAGQITSRLSEIPLDRDVIVYCASGHRATLAYGNLRKKGYTKIWNAGAMGAIKGLNTSTDGGN